jgi:hypothetical protein
LRIIKKEKDIRIEELSYLFVKKYKEYLDYRNEMRLMNNKLKKIFGAAHSEHYFIHPLS